MKNPVSCSPVRTRPAVSRSQFATQAWRTKRPEARQRLNATRMRVKRKATKDEFFLRLSEGAEDSLNMAKAKAKQQQDVVDDLRAKIMDSVSQANKARSEIEKVTIPCTNSAKA